LYYRKAAMHGDVDAQTEVARCLFFGIGTAKDLFRSLAWYKKAAKRGDSDAQYALGRAYELGEGVVRRPTVALHWYKKAATQGHEDARKAATDLQSRMPQHVIHR
jgi:TPR repeat protein